MAGRKCAQEFCMHMKLKVIEQKDQDRTLFCESCGDTAEKLTRWPDPNGATPIDLCDDCMHPTIRFRDRPEDMEPEAAEAGVA